MKWHAHAVWMAMLGAAVLLSGCPCGPEEQGELTPLSGAFGYLVTGPWNFEGTLTKEYPGDPEWVLEGRFLFPNPGYVLLATHVLIAESYPEQVLIRFNVLLPVQEITLPVIQEEPVRVTVAAADRASFDIRFLPRCLRLP